MRKSFHMTKLESSLLMNKFYFTRRARNILNLFWLSIAKKKKMNRRNRLIEDVWRISFFFLILFSFDEMDFDDEFENSNHIGCSVWTLWFDYELILSKFLPWLKLGLKKKNQMPSMRNIDFIIFCCRSSCRWNMSFGYFKCLLTSNIAR